MSREEAKELSQERELREMRSKVEDLGNEDWQVRLRAISSLIQIKKSEEFYKEAVPAIILATKDAELFVRQAAIPALGDIGVKARPAIDRLIEILQLDAIDEVKGAVYSLGKIGPEAIDAVKILVALFKNPSDELHKAISWAIGIIGPDSLGLLKENIINNDARVRRGVVVAIGNMGPIAISLLDNLIATLNDSDLLTKIEAAKAIGNLRASPEVSRAITSLDKLLDDADPDVRWTSAEALRKIGSEEAMKYWARYQPIANVEAIAKQLTNQDKAVRENAATSLYEIVAKGKDNQLELLKFAFSDRHWKVPLLLCDALGKLEGEAFSVLEDASMLLDHEQPAVRKSACGLIGKIGSSAMISVPKIIVLLKDVDKEVRTSAGVALELIGGKDAEKALKSFDWM